MNNSIVVDGRLIDLSEPRVMGILNVTPDSFYADSRSQTEDDIIRRANEIVTEGGLFIDVGACSTRPGATVPSEEEEMRRLRLALPLVRRSQPDAIVSVDTFRPNVARMAVEEYGVHVVNDVSGVSSADGSGLSAERRAKMFSTVARLRVPYIYMSSQPTLETIVHDFVETVHELRELGMNDMILDPGFGFGKTLQQNYDVLAGLDKLVALGQPLLVGVSRKSMISRLLGIEAVDSLNGTTVLNTITLMKGASILRVHDVREAVEAVRLTGSLRYFSENE